MTQKYLFVTLIVPFGERLTLINHHLMWYLPSFPIPKDTFFSFVINNYYCRHRYPFKEGHAIQLWQMQSADNLRQWALSASLTFPACISILHPAWVRLTQSASEFSASGWGFDRSALQFYFSFCPYLSSPPFYIYWTLVTILHSYDCILFQKTQS